MSKPIRILVENRGDELIARGIFADLCREGRVEIVMCWVASSVVTFAQSSLLQDPEQPVAAVLNCPAGQDPVEFREPIVRVLSRVAPLDAFHVALAIPDMTDWARADQAFTATIEAQSQALGARNKYDVAVDFKNWTSSNQFDRDQVMAKNAEFEELVKFLKLRLQPVGVI